MLWSTQWWEYQKLWTRQLRSKTVLFRDVKMTSTSEAEIQISHYLYSIAWKLEKCARQKYWKEILPASLLAITVMLMKITFVIGHEGLKMKSTMRAFRRRNILICFLVFLVYVQKVSTILVHERCVTFL